MSADILRPDGSLDAWIYPPDHGLVLVAPHTTTHKHYRTSSPVIGQKKLDRPKSVPATLHSGRHGSARSSHNNLYGGSRPKTATGSVKADCGRVLQVEHEPTRKQSLENHLPSKKIKPPPWQRALDTQPVPCMVSPGYTLSRSKNKVAMTINTDNFFDPEPGDHEGLGRETDKDPLVQQLKQQIDDLTLYLEEERLNHRDTKRKAAEQLEEKMDEMNRQHENDMRLLEDQFQEQLMSQKDHHSRDMESLTDSSEGALSKMHGDIEFLQGAFESYKSQLHMEMDERWRKRETELKDQQDDMLHDKLKELRSKVQMERVAEKSDLTQIHQRDLHNLKQEHKKELNQLMRRFSNSAKELEDYKKTQEDLEERTQELELLKGDYDSVCQQTADLTRQLTDMKVELVTFEQTFQDRVQGIDDKYKNQLHELMTQNTELRRLYVKKCGELFDEKVESDNTRMDSLQSAKDAMKVQFEGDTKAAISQEIWKEIDRRLAAGDRARSTEPNHN